MQTSQHPELAAQPVALLPLLLCQLFSSFPVSDLPPGCAGTRHPALPAASDSNPSFTSNYFVSFLVGFLVPCVNEQHDIVLCTVGTDDVFPQGPESGG